MAPLSRFGLQARMTASYVLVTAAAVIVVEAIALGVILPNFLAGQDLNNRVVYTAGDIAEHAGQASLSTTALVLPPDFIVGTPSSTLGPGHVQDNGQGLVVPQITGSLPSGAAPVTLALVLSTDGTVLASSYPHLFPVGSSVAGVLPEAAKAQTVGIGSTGGVTGTSTGQVAWSLQSVLVALSKNRGVVGPGVVKPSAPDGFVYVQAPVQPFKFGAVPEITPLLGAGVVVLLLALPVGTLFGFVTSRALVRRLRRLAATTATVAEGDFSPRVHPGASDEVGRLERNFNEMAERLAHAVDRERALADKSARQAERNRISRELHDSISQDLFSISLLAAGLEKALPPDSPLQAHVRTLVESAEATNREMRALLLELRPATLDDKGLVPALEELTSAYESRLGIKIDSELEALRMEPAAELAALRIAQEGLANAVRHAHASNIKLALRRSDGHVDVTVADDGDGFEPGASEAKEGLGLRLMRERVEELGGTLTITSDRGKGSVVVASIPEATS